ncbi:MAG TPA: hypothetical protein VLL77_06340 [Anaerolineales bacterium]|nr:hypothetical protein [Anaerolineales bacterium]
MLAQLRTRHMALALLISMLVLATACTSVFGIGSPSDLESTQAAQGAILSDLATQVAGQDETESRQWEAISYLSTQMPYAVGWITPIPPGVTISPTPYLPGGQAPADIHGYPSETRTGIAGLDRILDAVLTGSPPLTLDLVRLTTTACSTAEGLGGPPKCQDGETEGTLVQVLPVSYGEGTFIRSSNAQSALDFSVMDLLAVYRVPATAYRADYWPAGEYGIVFTTGDGGFLHVITLIIEDGKIVRIDFTPMAPSDLTWAPIDDFVLPPLDP